MTKRESQLKYLIDNWHRYNRKEFLVKLGVSQQTLQRMINKIKSIDPKALPDKRQLQNREQIDWDKVLGKRL